jgi:Tfp pilus assembly protein PilZ
MTVVWKKYTVLKSTILSGSVKTSKEVWAAYSDYIKNNGHYFEEGKKHSIKPESPLL